MNGIIKRIRFNDYQAIRVDPAHLAKILDVLVQAKLQ